MQTCASGSCGAQPPGLSSRPSLSVSLLKPRACILWDKKLPAAMIFGPNSWYASGTTLEAKGVVTGHQINNIKSSSNLHRDSLSKRSAGRSRPRIGMGCIQAKAAPGSRCAVSLRSAAQCALPSFMGSSTQPQVTVAVPCSCRSSQASVCAPSLSWAQCLPSLGWQLPATSCASWQSSPLHRSPSFTCRYGCHLAAAAYVIMAALLWLKLWCLGHATCNALYLQDLFSMGFSCSRDKHKHLPQHLQ